MTHEVVGSGQGETRMPEHIGLSPAEEGWTVASDNETCLVVALNCNVLQHAEAATLPYRPATRASSRLQASSQAMKTPCEDTRVASWARLESS
jgi:hypothetical protein